uniref:Uncharacterized protein n=1 Tax=Anguilla anguilla TaxID=7936 RepID=A0A0E9Q3H4_ANGAN
MLWIDRWFQCLLQIKFLLTLSTIVEYRTWGFFRIGGAMGEAKCSLVAGNFNI